MKIAFFDTHQFERSIFETENKTFNHEITFFENRLTEQSANLAAGFNHVDLVSARDLGLKIVRVPEYSPHAAAEHAVALVLSLNRRIHRAYNRVREGNFSLNGLVGFNLYKKTVGIIGTGRIG